MKFWISRNFYLKEDRGPFECYHVDLSLSKPIMREQTLPSRIFVNESQSIFIYYSTWVKATGIKINGGEVMELEICPGEPIKVAKERL